MSSTRTAWMKATVSGLSTTQAKRAKRWSGAIAEVTAETLSEVGPVDVKSLVGSIKPTGQLPKLAPPSKESAISALNGFLDAAGDAREAKKAGKAPAPAPVPEPKSNALNTPFNAPLFFAVPAASIVGLVYYLATLDA